MGLSTWKDIKDRAVIFSNEWKNETYEKGEAQSFWNDFFEVYGIKRRRVAVFEKQVKKLNKNNGYIDLFWPGTLIIEHKSKDRNLTEAYYQAIDYTGNLQEEELPRYILTCDFQNFELYDLEERRFVVKFPLKELHKNVHFFSFFLGHIKQNFQEDAPVNIKAAKLMSSLRDALNKDGYQGHDLEIFLGRMLFCLFADDTGIFYIKDHLSYYLENKTNDDGRDLGPHIASIFQILDTPPEKRQKNIDEDLAQFPYVNGALFSRKIQIPSFNKSTRDLLIKCCKFNWEKISPAIFGSMFESIMLKRRDFGAHFTSEENIFKVLKPLFLDGLNERLTSVKTSAKGLDSFLDDIKKIKILDPACGCGNFLIVAYRELRLLEIEAHKFLRKLRGDKHKVVMDTHFSGIDVDSMFGIELHESAAKIAQVALWIVDHQMNIQLSQELGTMLMRIPLKKSPKIIYKNAVTLDWNKEFGSVEFSFIVGNPPYVGKTYRNDDQKDDMDSLKDAITGYKDLDYVSLWFHKAAAYLELHPNTKVSYVSTNSICQGEQAPVLWKYLFGRNLHIEFAYKDFKWRSESSKSANVHVVIVGLTAVPPKQRFLYTEEDNIWNKKKVKEINQYLVDSPNLFLESRRSNPFNAPVMKYGSMANDGGALIISEAEYLALKKSDKVASSYCRVLLGSDEYLSGTKRYCLWLKDVDPADIKASNFLKSRVERCKKKRAKSKRAATKKLANTPHIFGECRQPEKSYILVPRTSSEKRVVIPMEIVDESIVITDLCSSIATSETWHLGVLQSSLFMSWVANVCGRIKSDYRLSNEIVYNNFPWPQKTNQAVKLEITNAMKKILSLRVKYSKTAIGDLYDPTLTPSELVEAHRTLDKIVNKLYGLKADASKSLQFASLVKIYNRYVAKEIAAEAVKMAKLKKLLEDKIAKKKGLRKAV